MKNEIVSFFQKSATDLAAWHGRQKAMHPILVLAAESLGIAALGAPFGLLPLSCGLALGNFYAAKRHELETENPTYAAGMSRCSFLESQKNYCDRQVAQEVHSTLVLLSIVTSVGLAAWQFGGFCDLSAEKKATDAVRFEMSKADCDGHFLMEASSARGKSSLPKAITWSFAEAKATGIREASDPRFFTIKAQPVSGGEIEETKVEVFFNNVPAPVPPKGYELEVKRQSAHIVTRCPRGTGS